MFARGGGKRKNDLLVKQCEVDALGADLMYCS